MSEPLVLGIESSCDETGVGIVRGTQVLANAVASSVDEHVRFGGVVPEVASRAHLEAFVPMVEKAQADAGVSVADVDAIAVTCGPGLSGALLVGVAAAKALALAHDKPLYGVNHLAGHVAADQLENGRFTEPVVALLVSGGHTEILLVRDLATDIELLGSTLDDAAGEAFDKVARILGLPYPGGPQIDAAARQGDGGAVAFPRGLTAAKDRDRYRWDFSFSGLKSAVLRHVELQRSLGNPIDVPDIAASFQDAVCDVLSAKAADACEQHGVETLVVAGGVAANGRLREMVAERARARGVNVRVPRPSFCTDNGAMIAAIGAEVVARGLGPSDLALPVNSGLAVTTIAVQSG